MISIDLYPDVARLRRSLGDKAREQLRYATARALTATARQIQDAERVALRSVFDNPTPFTLSAIGSRGATKTNLEARVFVRPIAARYLAPYEVGGVHALPPSAVGGTLLNPKDVRLNQYGNLPAGTLARLRSRGDIYIGAIATRSGTINGVWQRLGVTRGGKAKRTRQRGTAYTKEHGALKLLIRFGNALPVPEHQHLDFKARAAAMARRIFPAELHRALAATLQA